MNKQFIETENFKVKMFCVLAAGACVSNFAGLISNVLLCGFSLSMMICGTCLLIKAALSVIGIKTRKTELCAAVMLIIMNFFEFPYLYYEYSKNVIVYFILGIVGIVIFVRKRLKNILAVLALAEYSSVIFICDHFYSSRQTAFSETDSIASTICSLLISGITILILVGNIINQYSERNNELEKLSTRLNQEANLDPLTKVYNRRYLSDYIDDLIEEHNTGFCIALLDLDNFSDINKKYGQLYGDVVLKNFSSSLKNCSDGMGITARYSGEKFVLVLKNTDLQRAAEIIAEVRNSFQDFAVKSKGEIFTFSGGAVEYKTGYRITNLFGEADKKLQKAKSGGSGKVVY